MRLPFYLSLWFSHGLELAENRRGNRGAQPA